MKKAALALTLAFALLISLMFFVQSAKSSSKTIVVPDDYPTIQAAVDNASSGDILHVKNGIYKESIVVDKPLSIVGEDKETTIIDGGGAGTVVRITSSNVEIANFTIRNAGTSQWFGHGFPDSCIDAEESTDVTIRNNFITNTTVGVWSYASINTSYRENFVSNTTTMGIIGYSCTNSTIGDNLLQECGIVGIHLDGTSVSCKVENNTITNCEEGIDIEKSAENTVEGNNLLNNNVGVIFSSSDDNYVQYCTVQNSSVGIGFYESNGSTFSHNSFIDNENQVSDLDSTQSSPSAETSVNSWDDGKEGNYWSDYQSRYPNASEVDASGVWNTPYVIDANNVDHYPLMKLVPVQEFPSWITLPPLIIIAVGLLLFSKKRKH